VTEPRRNWLPRSRLAVWTLWIVLLALVTLGLLQLRPHLNEAHIALAYLVVVVVGGARSGRAVGFTLAGLAFACFDWFFVPPYGTFVVDKPVDWIPLIAFLAISLIVTQLFERARHEADAARSARMRESIVASVSHDLRTPLTTIKALAHDLAAGGDERAEMIEAEADRLTTLVGDLLDYSRINSGTMPLAIEPNEAEDLLGAALQQVTGAAAGRTINVGLDPAHPLRSGAAVVLGDRLGLMVNEEDHLRLQALRSGFAVNEAFADLDRLDRELGAHVPYSYHGEFGFLTACPTNVGTGMRASVLIHLPGLNLTKEISRVLTSLQQMGLTYRGLYGEGSEVVGNFLQISNQTTLGRTEEDLLDLLLRVVRHVVEREEEARRVLLRDAGYIIEDKLWRAYGTLRYARSLTFDEAMKYLSGVRLAVGLKLISGLSVYTLNKLLIFSQAAHLASTEGRSLTESETNLARARYVRKALDEEAGSVG